MKRSRDEAATAWRRIAMTLANSYSRDDQLLARQIAEFVSTPSQIRKVPVLQREHERPLVRGEGPEAQHAHAPSLGHSRGVVRVRRRLHIDPAQLDVHGLRRIR